MRNIQKIVAASMTMLALAALNTGCASSQSTNEANMGAVNSKCPIQPEDPVNPAVYTMWHDKKVAFCCAGCIDEWDRKTDDQKAALIEKAK